MDEKQKEKWRKKMEESCSELRQKAIAVERAIQNERKRKQMEEAIKKERKRQLQRKFATPTTADEAEGELPTLQELLGRKREKTILESGTLLEKIRLYFIYSDFEGFFGASQSLRDEVKVSLAASINSQEDKDLGLQCAKEFRAFKVYGERLSYYYQIYQTSFAILARLVNLWDNYEREAERLTAIYRRWAERDPEVARWVMEINTIHTGTTNKWEGASLCFDGEKGAFYVDVDKAPDEEESLYSQIKKRAASTAESLSDFKAFAMIAEEYVAKSKLKYMPISIRMSKENAEMEKYTRYLVKNLSFFRSEVNYRKCNGETITPEEEKRAVIPDYYEVRPTPEVYDNCRMGLEQLLKK